MILPHPCLTNVSGVPTNYNLLYIHWTQKTRRSYFHTPSHIMCIFRDALIITKHVHTININEWFLGAFKFRPTCNMRACVHTSLYAIDDGRTDGLKKPHRTCALVCSRVCSSCAMYLAKKPLLSWEPPARARAKMIVASIPSSSQRAYRRRTRSFR